MRRLGLLIGLTCLCTHMGQTAYARPPTESRVSRDVTRYFKSQWPDQPVVHVSRKTDQCEAGTLSIKNRAGKTRTVHTCVILADVFTAQGDYRYHIFRDSKLHYQGQKLLSIEPGELEKAWKEGGVPAPDAEQAVALLTQAAAGSLGTDAKVTVREMGLPRPYGDTYRITLLVDVAYSRDGKPAKKEQVLATLESTGGPWRPAENLLF